MIESRAVEGNVFLVGERCGLGGSENDMDTGREGAGSNG